MPGDTQQSPCHIIHMQTYIIFNFWASFCLFVTEVTHNTALGQVPLEGTRQASFCLSTVYFGTRFEPHVLTGQSFQLPVPSFVRQALGCHRKNSLTSSLAFQLTQCVHDQVYCAFAGDPQLDSGLSSIRYPMRRKLPLDLSQGICPFQDHPFLKFKSLIS